jgi:hypothetical protein
LRTGGDGAPRSTKWTVEVTGANAAAPVVKWWGGRWGGPHSYGERAAAEEEPFRVEDLEETIKESTGVGDSVPPEQQRRGKRRD